MDDNKERLFFCKVSKPKILIPVEKKVYTKSPLNYTGAKFKILDQVFKYFPSNINNFIDLFCGSCEVGINNYNSKKTFYIDKQKEIIDFYKMLKREDVDKLISKIEGMF